MEPIILPRISDQKPLVSVISITYNHEPYIRDCLEGFLMQKTDFPVEIIIHDDASTDHTADIIREYYKKRPDLFHVIIERENIYGRKPIMQPLYDQAKGKYIALCEGDDYWTDSLKLQKQFDFMEKHEQYTCIVHKYELVDKNKEILKYHSFGYYEKSGDFTLEDYEKITGLPSQLGTIFLSNNEKIMNILRILPHIKGIPGDTKLFTTLLYLGPIYRMEEKMSAYRQVSEKNGTSWTSRRAYQKGGTNTPFEEWMGFCRLINLFNALFNRKMKFSRKKTAMGDSILVYTRNNLCYTSIFKLIKYEIKQSGAIPHSIAFVFHSLLKKIKHNK